MREYYEGSKFFMRPFSMNVICSLQITKITGSDIVIINFSANLNYGLVGPLLQQQKEVSNGIWTGMWNGLVE